MIMRAARGDCLREACLGLGLGLGSGLGLGLGLGLARYLHGGLHGT